MTGTGSIRVGFVSGVRHAGSYADLLRSDPRVSLVGGLRRILGPPRLDS